MSMRMLYLQCQCACFICCYTLQHQVCSYAKAAGKGGKSAKPAVAAAAPAKEADPLAPPVFKVKRVPQVNKGDPVAQMTGAQVSFAWLKGMPTYSTVPTQGDTGVESSNIALCLCSCALAK